MVPDVVPEPLESGKMLLLLWPGAVAEAVVQLRYTTIPAAFSISNRLKNAAACRHGVNCAGLTLPVWLLELPAHCQLAGKLPGHDALM